jgi:hypothetical protein
MANYIYLLLLLACVPMIAIYRKTSRWNDQPAQQELATVILKGTLRNLKSTIPEVDIHDVLKIMNANNWGVREASDRCAHAVSMIKTRVPPDVYLAAKRQGEILYVSLRSL